VWEAEVQIPVKKTSSVIALSLTFLIVMFLIKSIPVFATCSSGGPGGGGGSGGGTQANGSAGTSGAVGCGSGGGGGGGSAGAGNGGNGAGGGVLLKNTSGSMTISGTIDTRGGGSSTTNGGTVKIFYSGSVPSTIGVTSGRTYTQSLSVNTAPGAPTLLSPASGATNQSKSPLLQVKTTDADSDYLKYKILLYNSDCSTGLQTYDETSSQTGWSGQDQQTGTAYTGSSSLSGSTGAIYGLAILSANTTYCWQAAAIDPAGTNTFGANSSTQLFTTGSAISQTQVTGGSTLTGGSLVR